MIDCFENAMKRMACKKGLSICIVVLATCSLIPLVVIAKYNHPCTDDFAYGSLTAQTWTETGSLTETIKAAFTVIQTFYHEWQGTFSAIFFMALQPAVFGEDLYFLGTIFILGSYLTGFLLLCSVIFKEYLNAKKHLYLIVCLPVLILSVQLVPSPVNSYYWFNGSVFYTFFYGLELMLLAVLLKYIKEKEKGASIFYLIVAMLLAFFIGGGNYVTILQTLILVFSLVIYRIVTKKSKVIPLMFVGALLLVTFAFSALAPGTAVRQSSFPGHPSALLAIVLSFKHAAFFVLKWTDLYVLALCLFLWPFILQTVENTPYSFQNPFLILLVTFSIFTANFTPPLYAMGAYPQRIIDIIYYCYYLFLFFNLFYFCGWMVKKRGQNPPKNEMNHSEKKIRKYAPAFLCICGFMFLAAYVQKPQIAAVEAIRSLWSGEARLYDMEADARKERYLDPSQSHVVVNEFSVKPYLIYCDDITTDVSSWKNENVAIYYHKKSVLLNAK